MASWMSFSSAARATALAAVLFARSCPDVLAHEVCSHCTDVGLSLLQTRAHQLEEKGDSRDGGDGMPASEVQASSMAAPDLEQSLLSAEIKVGQVVSDNKGKSPPTRKIHVHLHKVGGTLMCQMARAAGETIPLPMVQNCNWNGHDGLRASGRPEMFPSCADRHAEYSKQGWTYTQVEREIVEGDLCKGFRYSVLLRDPIDLITSNINYEESGHKSGFNASVRVEKMRMLSTGQSDEVGHLVGLSPTFGWKFMDNMQTRLLSGALDVPPGKVSEEHLAIAKSRLANFHAVGKLSDMADPVKRGHFFAKMGWNISLELPHSNDREHVEELTETDKNYLVDLNKHDYDLYNSFN